MVNAGYIGALDIGGTKMLAGLYDDEGQLLARKRSETLAFQGVSQVIARAALLVRELAQETGLSPDNLTGIGCSVPGPLDSERGVVIFSPNLAWRDVPLAALLSQALDVPARIEDDARCAALGEARRGGARGAQNAVYVTISTGIGGGVILNGHIYRGSHGCAGEVGHMTLDAAGPPCACGNVGCFESLASGTAIAVRARQTLMHGDETILARFRDDPALLTAEQVIDAANLGDAVALRILETTAMYIGIGLAAIATTYDPEVIVLGGGVIHPDGLLIQKARETFQARVISPLGSLVRIVPAQLGDESALYGAAALANNGRPLATRQVIDV